MCYIGKKRKMLKDNRIELLHSANSHTKPILANSRSPARTSHKRGQPSNQKTAEGLLGACTDPCD